MARQYKSFRIGRFEFRPCEFQDSTGLGYRWYVVMVHEATGMDYAEWHCPKFRSKADCRQWANDHR